MITDERKAELREAVAANRTIWVGDDEEQLFACEVWREINWPQPVPVSERLPELGEPVLLFLIGNSGFHPGWVWGVFDGSQWSNTDCVDYPLSEVSHWLPLPPAPVIETKKEPEQCESK